jgi:hypothetical protein
MSLSLSGYFLGRLQPDLMIAKEPIEFHDKKDNAMNEWKKNENLKWNDMPVGGLRITQNWKISWTSFLKIDGQTLPGKLPLFAAPRHSTERHLVEWQSASVATNMWINHASPLSSLAFSVGHSG